MWSRRKELHASSADYRSAALLLSYAGLTHHLLISRERLVASGSCRTPLSPGRNGGLDFSGGSGGLEMNLRAVREALSWRRHRGSISCEFLGKKFAAFEGEEACL